MSWEQMSIDEYAEYEKQNGTHLIKAGNIWWRKVRPLFYRPLFPFQKLNREEAYQLNALRLGFQYAVADTAQANSYLKFMVYPNVQNYGLDTLSRKRRYYIKKAIKVLEVRTIDDCRIFIERGYQIYKEFYNRTRYNFRKDRLKQNKFEEWSNNVLSNKKIKVHGIYNKNNIMVAIHISFLVNNILFNSTFFACEEGLNKGATDIIDHIIREDASKQGNIDLIYDGPYKGKSSIDQAKLIRGDVVHSIPAYLAMNSLILKLVKHLSKSLYQKILNN